MGPKKKAIFLSRNLTSYTVILAPPGGKFKVQTYFWQFSQDIICQHQVSVCSWNQNQILHILRSNLNITLAKLKFSNLEVPNENGRLFWRRLGRACCYQHLYCIFAYFLLGETSSRRRPLSILTIQNPLSLQIQPISFTFSNFSLGLSKVFFAQLQRHYNSSR